MRTVSGIDLPDFPSNDRSLEPPDIDDYYDVDGCDVCDMEEGPAPEDLRLCDGCGLCLTHCNGHTDDELAADQGLDDDIDF